MLFSRLSCKYIVTIGFASLILACSQALYVPAPENVHDVDRIAALTEGRNLYIRHCGSCHNLYKPQTYSHEKWAVEMHEMKEEAKINDKTAQQILDYLTGYKPESTME